MVLDTFFLNIQQYKVRIEGKVEQSRERTTTFTLHLSVVAIEKGAFWPPSTFLNIQQYKVRIEGKVEQSRERSSTFPLHLSVVAIEKGAFWQPSTMVTNYVL